MDGTVVAHVAKLAADVLGVDASSVDGDDSFAQLGGACWKRRGFSTSCAQPLWVR